MRATVRVLFEMHHAQGFQYPALDLAFRTGLHPKPESHVVAHGHMREQRVVLIHDPQPPLLHGQAADVLAVKQDAAGLQGKRPGDRLEQHGLAGACLAGQNR